MAKPKPRAGARMAEAKQKKASKPKAAATTETKRPRGRPCVYSAAVADKICKRIAGGETLKQVCRSPGMPPESTVRTWVLDDRHGFAARYARARELQLENWSDDIVDIADDGVNDWVETEGKGTEYNGDHLQRSRLRIDARKWLLSRLKPERYGDRIAVGGDPHAPPVKHEVGVGWMTETEAQKRGWA